MASSKVLFIRVALFKAWLTVLECLCLGFPLGAQNNRLSALFNTLKEAYCCGRVTAIPGNMPGAVRKREHLSREVPPGKPLPGSASWEVPPGTPLPGSASREVPPETPRSTPEVVPGQGRSRWRKVVPGQGRPHRSSEVVPGGGRSFLVKVDPRGRSWPRSSSSRCVPAPESSVPRNCSNPILWRARLTLR